MTIARATVPDPHLNLVHEREIEVPQDRVWVAWAKPEHVSQWFTPAPRTVTKCEIDLRPGGLFRTIMRSPEGREFPNVGCSLEVVPIERLVSTDGLLPGDPPPLKPFFTAIVTLEPIRSGTRYTATALHRDEAGKRRHEELGFRSG